MPYIFYKTTNTKNGKFYYGVHKGTSGDSYLGSGVAIREAIKKYGKSVFLRQDLAFFETKEAAYEFERLVVSDDAINDPTTLCGEIRVI